jgi:hypothetical protein
MNALAPKACPGCTKQIRKGCEVCCSAMKNLEYLDVHMQPKHGAAGQVPACTACDGSGLKASPIAALGVIPCPDCQSTGYGSTEAVRCVLARREREKKRAASAPPPSKPKPSQKKGRSK